MAADQIPRQVLKNVLKIAAQSLGYGIHEFIKLFKTGCSDWLKVLKILWRNDAVLAQGHRHKVPQLGHPLQEQGNTKHNNPQLGFFIFLKRFFSNFFQN